MSSHFYSCLKRVSHPQEFATMFLCFAPLPPGGRKSWWDSFYIFQVVCSTLRVGKHGKFVIKSLNGTSASWPWVQQLGPTLCDKPGELSKRHYNHRNLVAVPSNVSVLSLKSVQHQCNRRPDQRCLVSWHYPRCRKGNGPNMIFVIYWLTIFFESVACTMDNVWYYSPHWAQPPFSEAS